MVSVSYPGKEGTRKDGRTKFNSPGNGWLFPYFCALAEKSKVQYRDCLLSCLCSKETSREIWRVVQDSHRLTLRDIKTADMVIWTTH